MTKAYVIGASLAALLAASALTGHFDQVIVMERDELPDRATSRRGVPQGRQLHALMTRGLIAFDELLPGTGCRKKHVVGAASTARSYGISTEASAAAVCPRTGAAGQTHIGMIRRTVLGK